MYFAEIILPIRIPGTFTYRVPEQFADVIQIGSRVIVLLGNRKIYAGIVYSLHNQTPDAYHPKELIDVLDDSPIIGPHQLSYFDWMSRYYMCTLGEVMQAAIPSGLKLTSESYVTVNSEVDLEELKLTDKEHTIISHLQNGELRVDEINKILNVQSSYHHLKNLSDKKIIQVFDRVKDKYVPRKVHKIRLGDDWLTEEVLDEVAKDLEKKTKQLEVLIRYLEIVPVLEDIQHNEKGILKKELLGDSLSASSLSTLIKKGIFVEFTQIIPRFEFDNPDQFTAPELTPDQEKAKQDLIAGFESFDTMVLNGVTGSGKTEIYISLIQDILDAGGQVLYLLPEIALTTQIIKRLAHFFGSSFGVYHSKYSDNERVEIWQKVLSGELQFVVGVRSAIFLPFPSLSLIVIDEEHEYSYKQYEPAPRYHARDAAIYLAQMMGAKSLLGTATPSLETYYNTIYEKYGLVTLNKRYRNVRLPETVFADLTRERKRRTIKGNFSSLLIDQMNQELENSNQIIIFQNRRGYAPYVSCENCAHTPKCPHCDVSLTYHIHQHFLICHYCGHKTGMISECPECKSNQVKAISYGTEKLEEELEILFPNARIARMDLDTTRSKYSYQRIIDDFEAGVIDILVGTQMVTKGLDFDKVMLVGVFDTDRMIHFPDFRSHERAYQLIHQVSGRAGRRDKVGKVIIQTNDPNQPILQYLKNHHLSAFYQFELNERDRYHYPPFYRMIKITLKDKEKQVALNAAIFYHKELIRYLSSHRVIGPVEPIIGKIRNKYLYEFTLKIEKQGVKMPAIKEFLLTSRNMLQSQRLFKSVEVVFDVDPM